MKRSRSTRPECLIKQDKLTVIFSRIASRFRRVARWPVHVPLRVLFSIFFGFCAVPAVDSVTSVPLQEDYVDLEDMDPSYPAHAEVFTEELSYADDPILDCVSTGLEAEALIKKYGGDLFTPVDLAPSAATHPASFFREIRVLNYHPFFFLVSLIAFLYGYKTIAKGFWFP